MKKQSSNDKPFFARFLEPQELSGVAGGGGPITTQKYPSDDDEDVMTQKFPSDDDEGGVSI